MQRDRDQVRPPRPSSPLLPLARPLARSLTRSHAHARSRARCRSKAFKDIASACGFKGIIAGTRKTTPGLSAHTPHPTPIPLLILIIPRILQASAW